MYWKNASYWWLIVAVYMCLVYKTAVYGIDNDDDKKGPDKPAFAR
ncbi:MAG: hypothetical protein NZZ41_08000 [Candidatus Dojkabacteria bacterium]|nr:hypothetical protein [Candidatus Dojkabacteria bacterium]